MVNVTIVTPTGPLVVVRPVADRLLAEGVVSGDLNGVLHAADAATIKAALIAMAGTCDFCSAPGATNLFDVPDFDIPLGIGRSTGGWMACDTCADLVKADRREALFKRSIEALSFSKFSTPAIAELQARFWRGMDEKAEAAEIAVALGGYVDDSPAVPAIPALSMLSAREQRIEAVARITGLDRAKIIRLMRGDISIETVQKLVVWRKSFSKDVDPRVLADMLAAGGHKPLAPVLPHWQVALDMRFAAMRQAVLLADEGVPAQHFSPNETDLNDPDVLRRIASDAETARQVFVAHNRADVKALGHAETYSFNAETAQAIMLASASIPRDAPLSSVETPGNGRAGWFWFQAALPVRTTDDAPGTNALLWYWDERDGRPELRVSAYAVDGTGALVPAAYWCWGLTASLHDLVREVHAAYDHGEVLVATDRPFGREATVKGICDLSLFFLAACLWMKQRIVVGTPEHVERHARKRYMREHKLADPPSVQVIALRKSYRDPGGEPAGDGSGAARQYHHRWVVDGHPRLQACGPSRADRKLIWIAPYPKGPAGAPLLVRKRVYAVVR